MFQNKKITRIIVTVAVIAAVTVFLIVIIRLLSSLHSQNKKIDGLQESYTEILEENSKIEKSIENGEDESNIERIARDEYSYVNPEERIYYDSDAG